MSHKTTMPPIAHATMDSISLISAGVKFFMASSR
jgi:hypothetical protein